MEKIGGDFVFFKANCLNFSFLICFISKTFTTCKYFKLLSENKNGETKESEESK